VSSKAANLPPFSGSDVTASLSHPPEMDYKTIYLMIYSNVYFGSRGDERRLKGEFVSQ